MSLYIRVYNSFWNHRKTMRLRAKLGDDALWIMPRLWSYAADNCPDGDLSSMDANEIALAIGYTKDAQRMLEAMQQAQFIDKNMVIWDWDEHNAYHVTFSERAKKAAGVRWPKDRKGKDKKGDKHCFKDASSIQNTENPNKNDKSRPADMSMVEAYFIEIGLPKTEGERFWDFYTSKGWLVGKSPMKDWRAAARNWKKTWEKQNGSDGQTDIGHRAFQERWERQQRTSCPAKNDGPA